MLAVLPKDESSAHYARACSLTHRLPYCICSGKERSCSSYTADRNSIQHLQAVYCNLFCSCCYTTWGMPARPNVLLTGEERLCKNTSAISLSTKDWDNVNNRCKGTSFSRVGSPNFTKHFLEKEVQGSSQRGPWIIHSNCFLARHVTVEFFFQSLMPWAALTNLKSHNLDTWRGKWNFFYLDELSHLHWWLFLMKYVSIHNVCPSILLFKMTQLKVTM